jgi:hypothetical protein
MTDHGEPELLWCHGCGDEVEQLGYDDLCILCEEIDARVEAQLASAIVDYADHAIGVALDYLHPDDVRTIIDRGVAARGGAPGDGARLQAIDDRAHAFLDRRTARAAQRRDERRRDAGERGR